MQLAAFCVFEFCVGLFWPSMMKMRSQHVPEEARATIINFFRIPLNLFVCIVLYNVSATLTHLITFLLHHLPSEKAGVRGIGSDQNAKGLKVAMQKLALVGLAWGVSNTGIVTGAGMLQGQPLKTLLVWTPTFLKRRQDLIRSAALGRRGSPVRTRRRSPPDVVASLAVQVSSFPLSTMFGMCSAFLAACAICQRRLDRVVHAERGPRSWTPTRPSWAPRPASPA